jgi:hypothetical protein
MGRGKVLEETNFIVRLSGKKPNSFYIDYSGAYKISDIAKVTGMEQSTVKDIYISNDAVFDEAMEVYYFGSMEAAQKAIATIYSRIRSEKRGKLIFLTMQEIEYIRKALINEDSNTIHVKRSFKDKIFEKLNS